MKTLTQVVLPIAAVIGLVFGITIIMNYTSRPEKKEVKVSKVPLNFVKTSVAPSANDWLLRDWDSDVEVGKEGHFDFWFQNPHPQNVRLSFTKATCLCAGTQLGIISPNAWSNYLVTSAQAGLNNNAAPMIAVLNLASLATSIDWQPLGDKDNKFERSVPAAISQDNPQMGILRLSWKGGGQADDPSTPTRRLKATFAVQLPNDDAHALEFDAIYTLAPPFHVFVVGTTAQEVQLGELFQKERAQQDIIFWSGTRRELKLDLATNSLGDLYRGCIEWTPLEQLKDSECQMLSDMFTNNGNPLVRVRCAYKTRLTVYERHEDEKNGKKTISQLDLGPFAFGLKSKINEEDGGKRTTVVRCMVRGDLRVVGDRNNDRIDFGTSYPSSTAKSQKVRLISERSGLDLELVRQDCKPAYLVPTLKEESEKDGRKTWVLEVLIPEGTLLGALENGFIILKTKDSPPRRIRVPVKAVAHNG
jgi:hypothetical protein